jgi:hypothetical protein
MGYFRVRLRGRNVTRRVYKLEWRDAQGALMFSRRARAGRRLRYLEPVVLPKAPAKQRKTKIKRVVNEARAR